MSRAIWYILIVSVFAACEPRPLPNTSEGNIRFFVEGELDGNSFVKKAGEEGQFLHTGHELLEDQLWIYWGQFGQAGCVDCEDAIEIRIRDLDSFVEADATHMDSLLEEGPRDYYQLDGVQKRIRRVFFTNQSKNKNVRYRWSFGDGTISEEVNPVHDYLDPSLTEVLVCLETEEQNGCTTTICNEILLADSSCSVDFAHNLTPNSTYVEFESQVTGVPPFSYSWDFGDGGTASLGNPGYFYRMPGQYQVCLTVTDGQDCSKTMCKKIAADPVLCEHNFSYRIGNNPGKDFLQYGRIEILYTNTDGKVFTSAQQTQPSSSSFNILSREAYKENAADSPTYAFECSFTCRLWAEDGEEIEVTRGMSASACAYPQE